VHSADLKRFTEKKAGYFFLEKPLVCFDMRSTDSFNRSEGKRGEVLGEVREIPVAFTSALRGTGLMISRSNSQSGSRKRPLKG
jgi:hypothetical protein